MIRRSTVGSILAATALVLAAGAVGGSGVLGSASAAASSGCGKAPTVADGAGSIQSAGNNRSYILRLPANYDRNRAYRLIFGFHWNGGTSRDVDGGGTSGYPWSYYGLRALSDNSTIFVAPQGIGNGWANSGGRDLAFVDDMVRTFQAGLCIDTSQQFSMGFSYGGGMTFALACARPTVFRAVAVYAGGQLSGCDGGTQPVAYIGLHGLRDNVLPISTGRSLRDRFVRNNGCTAQNPREPAQGSLTHVITYYSGCRAGYPVAWAAFDDGHTPGPVDGVSGGSGAGERSWTRPVVWAFFTQFSNTTPTTTTTTTTTTTRPTTTTTTTTTRPTTTTTSYGDSPTTSTTTYGDSPTTSTTTYGDSPTTSTTTYGDSPTTTTPQPWGGCSATYRTIGNWPGGFQAEVTVTNGGTAPLNGWTVRMTLAGGQTVNNLWNGVNTGTSGTVSVKNAAYNGVVSPGTSTAFGFVANGSSTPAPGNVSCTTP